MLKHDLSLLLNLRYILAALTLVLLAGHRLIVVRVLAEVLDYLKKEKKRVRIQCWFLLD